MGVGFVAFGLFTKCGPGIKPGSLKFLRRENIYQCTSAGQQLLIIVEDSSSTSTVFVWTGQSSCDDAIMKRDEVNNVQEGYSQKHLSSRGESGPLIGLSGVSSYPDWFRKEIDMSVTV